MDQFKFQSWMGEIAYLSTRSINNTPESLWKWSVITQHARMSVIRSLPDKPWDFKVLSARKDLDLQLVVDHPEKDWNYAELSKHRELTIEILVALKEEPWDMKEVSHRKNNITPEDAVTHKHLFQWDWKYLTQAEKFQLMKENSELDWDWDRFSREGDYTAQDVLENPSLPWNWEYVSCLGDLTWENVEEHMDLPWDWTALCAGSIVTLDIMMKVNKPWSWCSFSQNPNVTREMVLANRMKPWSFYHLSHNDALMTSCNGKILLDFPEEDWDWEYVSSIVPLDFIRQHIDTLPFCPDGILNRHGMDWKFVKETASKLYWNWGNVISHVEMTTELLLELLPHFYQNDNVIDIIMANDDIFDCIEILVNIERLGYQVFTQGFEEFKCFNIKHLVKYKNQVDWNWFHVSCSPRITMDDIEAHMDLPWDWTGVSGNPNITWQFIFKHIELPWSEAYHTFQRALRKKNEYDMEKARMLSRTATLKEDIMIKSMDSRRFEKYLTEYNYDMAGDEYI